MCVTEIEGEYIDSYPTISSDSETLKIMKLSHSPELVDNKLQSFRILSFDLEVYNLKACLMLIKIKLL